MVDKELFIKQGADSEYQKVIPSLNQRPASKLEAEMQANIDRYEKMLQESSRDEERLVLSNTLQMMREQLSQLRFGKPVYSKQVSTQQSQSQMSQYLAGQNRAKNLLEIYNFYSKQQYVHSSIYTFDRIHHETNVLNIAKFMMFISQFNILNYNQNVNKRTLPQLFRKMSANFKELDFEEFKAALEKLSLMMFESDQQSSHAEKLEKLYKYMALDNPEIFRKKFKLINAPFNCKEKEGFRLLPQDIGRQIQLRKLEHKKLQDLKQKKIEDRLKQLKETDGQKLAKPNYQSTPQFSFNLNAPSHYVYEKYSYREGGQPIQDHKGGIEYTWQQLSQQSFTDLKQLQFGKFKPQDLIDQAEDKEDVYYLNQYNVKIEKKKSSHRQSDSKADLEKYGQLKNRLRPTQQFLKKTLPDYNPSQKYVSKNLHKSHYLDSNDLEIEKYKFQPQIAKSQLLPKKYMKRAQEIDTDLQKKEDKLLKQVSETTKALARSRFSLLHKKHL